MKKIALVAVLAISVSGFYAMNLQNQAYSQGMEQGIALRTVGSET